MVGVGTKMAGTGPEPMYGRNRGHHAIARDQARLCICFFHLFLAVKFVKGKLFVAQSPQKNFSKPKEKKGLGRHVGRFLIFCWPRSQRKKQTCRLSRTKRCSPSPWFWVDVELLIAKIIKETIQILKIKEHLKNKKKTYVKKKEAKCTKQGS